MKATRLDPRIEVQLPADLHPVPVYDTPAHNSGGYSNFPPRITHYTLTLVGEQAEDLRAELAEALDKPR
jgi:hypothetical protein